MAWIQAYGVSSAAGDGVAGLWNALSAAPEVAREEDYLFPGSVRSSVRDLLLGKMRAVFLEATGGERPCGRYGVILASTKGLSNDFIWNQNAPELERDPLSPLLEEFLQHQELNPVRRLCISNACSSALAALALAQKWLKRDLDEVYLLAADAVTPFVRSGFASLKLITADRPRPFARDRSGFFLGDGAACIVLSREPAPGALSLYPVGLDTEGSAVTRPSHSGISLVRAARQIPGVLDPKPDLILAHGTGTAVNDATEDTAFAELFPAGTPWVTGSKWRTGHTLAVSGAIDIILACEILRRQTAFVLATTHELDSSLKSRYLTRAQDVPGVFQRVLVSSLGFGGMHASALVEKVRT